MRKRILAVALALVLPGQAAGQNPKGTEGAKLELTYQAEFRPGMMVLPVGSLSTGKSQTVKTVARTVHQILKRDLDYSDHFEMVAETGVSASSPVDYDALRAKGAVWVVTADVQEGAQGTIVRVILHDAVYARAKATSSYTIPDPSHPNFRMAVHRISDDVVQWTGGKGMAATQVAYVVQNDRRAEIFLIDSDGEGARQLTFDRSSILSPTWSPDGRYMAYTSFKNGRPALYERDVRTGHDRVISNREGINISPAYSPDGKIMVFAGTEDDNTELFLFNIEKGCCLKQITRGRRSDSLSPTFSPDGRRIAFVSNRIGQPHIYVQDLAGGNPRIISRYEYGVGAYNQAPSWSPASDTIAYHSRVRGVEQLFLGSADGSGHRQLTASGKSESPSWAPNGRHLVFTGVRDGVRGLYILDTKTGRTRLLARGDLHLPEWSPYLGRR